MREWFVPLPDVALVVQDAEGSGERKLDAIGLGTLGGEDRIDGGEDALGCGFERDGNALALCIVEQPLDGVRPCEDGEMVIEPPGGPVPIDHLLIPGARGGRPDLTRAGIVVLDGHPVAGGVGVRDKLETGTAGDGQGFETKGCTARTGTGPDLRDTRPRFVPASCPSASRRGRRAAGTSSR